METESKGYLGRCVAPVLHPVKLPTGGAMMAVQFCKRKATTTRVVEEVICGLCTFHANQMDREEAEATEDK